ncbi:hypothetical protein CAEBREN_23659 [Caenorhabditis brenneri]|uniref:Uncharacterized protein n=1 Tax=Caenorhabditis brenneri TaxID=135651 RepID=G0NQL3_CAEBE|nr:hypothetical protein CAEBREN_23659 [Caenorhabditis brenneri]
MEPLVRSEWRQRNGLPDPRRSTRARRTVFAIETPDGPSRSVEIGEDAFQVQALEEARQRRMQECGICCEMFMPEYFRNLQNCNHAYCKFCTKRHITYSVLDNRVEVPCPGCGVDMHPDDVKNYCNGNPSFIAKYEQFSIRAALVKIPDARWCPAPDCGFAVIVPNGKKCPKIQCQKPGCDTEFCYDCKKKWHPGRKCATESAQVTNKNEVLACRPCPRCKALIMKENDGSCNHMHCTMCRAEFCWLCLKEITDFHYMTPSGCTFWGKRPWSGKKRLMWQIGSLIGSPAVIVATAVISVPIIVGMVPYSVGRKVYRTMKNESKTKRVISTAAAVTGSVIVSPAIAGVAVGLGVPFAIGYTYTMVPKTMLCDVIDYVRKKKRPEIVDITSKDLEEMHAATLPMVAVDPAPESRNADGTAPGPSSSSVTSSDYSEDFDSSDFMIEVCESL